MFAQKTVLLQIKFLTSKLHKFVQLHCEAI